MKRHAGYTLAALLGSGILSQPSGRSPGSRMPGGRSSNPRRHGMRKATKHSWNATERERRARQIERGTLRVTGAPKGDGRRVFRRKRAKGANVALHVRTSHRWFLNQIRWIGEWVRV